MSILNIKELKDSDEYQTQALMNTPPFSIIGKSRVAAELATASWLDSPKLCGKRLGVIICRCVGDAPDIHVVFTGAVSQGVVVNVLDFFRRKFSNSR